MPLVYRLLADLTVIIHFTYVAFVIFGWLAIALGGLLKWGWVRNRWFRSLHLAMIAIVVGEAWCGITCPLTLWEQDLRRAAGVETYAGSFIATLVHDLLFYDLPPSFFTCLYTLFGLLVALTFLLVPPDWRGKRKVFVAGSEKLDG